MKYAPSLCDFQNNFFMVERAKEPHFLVSKNGSILRSNRVGERFLNSVLRRHPNMLENLLNSLNEAVTAPTKKAITLLFGNRRKRVLRAVPVAMGTGYLIEIDRV